MSENVFFNGKSYNRYPESSRLSHQRYFNRAGGNGLLHRDVWEYYKGPIPDGHHIHHVDGNVTNNDIANLICIPAVEHFELHVEDRRRHGSSESNLQHLAKIREKRREQRENPVSVQCDECGAMFPSPTGRAKVCSQVCHSRRSRRRKRARGNVVDTE